MEESKMYVKLMSKVEKNKYKLIQYLINKTGDMSKINPEYIPFYADSCFMKVANSLLMEAENK